MTFGANPVTGTQGALPTNQFPASSVYPPNTAGSNPAHDFKALGGGPIRLDDDGNPYSEALMYTKDGDNETQGAKADTAATSGTGSWSGIALLKGILTKLLGTIAVSGTFWQATQPVSGTVTETNSAAITTATGAKTDSAATDSTSSWSAIALLKGIFAKLTGTLTISGAVTTSGTVTEANSASILTQVTNHAVTQGAGAAAGTSWRTSGDFTTISSLTAGGLNIDLLASTDISSYGYATITVSGTWVGTISAQYCDDNATFATYSSVFPSGGAGGATLATNGQYVIKGFAGRNFRLRMTNYTSGVANAIITFYTLINPILASQFISASQSGVWTQVPNAATTGGATPSHLISAATTNPTSVKASAGQVYDYNFSNSNAAVRYVKFFNKASVPTMGTDTPVKTIQVPANGNASGSFPVGVAFTTGIAFATTTGIADLDTGVVGAGDLSIDFDFK